MLRVQKVGQWAEVRSALNIASTKLGIAISKALKEEAEFFAKEIKANLISGGSKYGKKFKALAKTTVEARKLRGIKGKKPLIATKTLLNSIKAIPKGRNKYFVGIDRSARAPKGGSLAEVARLNEEGGVITINTSSMSGAFFKFLGMLMKKSGKSKPSSKRPKGVIIIKIPPRPFIAPVFQELYDNRLKAKARMMSRVAKNMGGIWALTSGKIK